MRRVFLTAGVGIAVVLLVAGAWLYQSDRSQFPPYEGPVESMTIAAYAGDVAALVYLAQEQGFFASQGLDVTITDHSSGRAALDAVVAGESNISTSGSAAVVADSFTNPELRILGTSAALDLNQVVARADRGISQPADLVGKKVAILQNSTPEFLFGRYLTYSDVSLDDVELVYLKPPEIMAAVADGVVDAGVIWDPLAYNLKRQLGSNAVSWSVQPNERDNFLIVSTDKWVVANPSMAERFTRAIVQAEDYAKRNPAAVQEFIAELFELDDDYVADVWEKITLTNRLPQSLLVQMEDQARWRLDSGISSGEVPNYLDFLYPDALKAVNPEAVTFL